MRSKESESGLNTQESRWEYISSVIFKEVFTLEFIDKHYVYQQSKTGASQEMKHFGPAKKN